LAEDRLSLQCYGCPLWALSRRIFSISEGLFSPKETLNRARLASENGTKPTSLRLLVSYEYSMVWHLIAASIENKV